MLCRNGPLISLPEWVVRCMNGEIVPRGVTSSTCLHERGSGCHFVSSG